MQHEIVRGDAVNQFRNEIDRLFQALATTGFPLSRFHQQQGQGGNILTPLADVYEDENGYRVIMEIPGFDPKNVEVTVSGNTLGIRAEHQQDQEQQRQQQNRNYYINERSHGTLRRQFHFPDDIDSNRINAEIRNGLLAITAPKAQETQQHRRIEVKSS